MVFYNATICCIITVMIKRHLQKMFEKYAMLYFQKHTNIRIVAVTGSTHAQLTEDILARLCEAQGWRVRMHNGQYRTPLEVLCSLLGLKPPSSDPGIAEYYSLLRAAKIRYNENNDVDIIIQRFDTHHYGDIQWLLQFVTPDIGILTSLEDEPASQFQSIQEVAQERMSLLNGSNIALVNHDEVAGQYAELDTNPEIYTYGLGDSTDYHYEIASQSLEYGVRGEYVMAQQGARYPLAMYMVHESAIRSVVAGVTTALLLGVNLQFMITALERLRPLFGKMNILDGVGETYVFDCSDGAIPEDVAESLRTLYQFEGVSSRIPVLGDFNQEYDTQVAYEWVANMCRPEFLSWIVLYGENMERFFAPIARRLGCQVHIAQSKIEALSFARSVANEDTLFLVQGRPELCMEEIVKGMVNADQYVYLVRQDSDELEQKGL